MNLRARIPLQSIQYTQCSIAMLNFKKYMKYTTYVEISYSTNESTKTSEASQQIHSTCNSETAIERQNLQYCGLEISSSYLFMIL